MKGIKPVISVVIPAYNEEKLLPKCLTALRNQDFKKPFEIILVDNCSTDKTAEIGKKYRCRVIREPRKGQIFARQKGCLKARGKIIAMLDADSIPVRNWLSVIFREFTNTSDELGAITNIFTYEEHAPLWVKIHDKLTLKPSYIFGYVLFHTFRIIGGNTAFLRKNFLSVGGYDINNRSIGE